MTRDGAAFLRGLALLALPAVILAVSGWRPVVPAGVYLPLHVGIEIFIAFVGFATFAVQWYAAGARGASHARARLIGAAFLGMALLEVAHLLVFPGMPGFLGPSSTERGIFYWLSGRFSLTVVLAAAASIPRDAKHWAFRREPLTAAALVVVAATVVAEALLPYSGTLHVAGDGLTNLKLFLEAAVGAVAAVGAALNWRRFRSEGEKTHARIALALAVVVVAEACFSFYATAYDVFNLLGHAYSFLAAALIFDALFAAALLEPYGRMEAASRELATTNEYLARLRGHIEGELAATIARLQEKSESEAAARGELEAAIEASPGGLIVHSTDGRIITMNAGAERILRYGGQQRDLPVLARWASLLPRKEDGTALADEENPIVRALRGETVHGLSLVIDPPGGTRCWIRVSAAPIRGPAGAIVGAVSNLTDVTEIQELQAERQDLMRAVSHDLRNPLQIVLLQAERLQRALPASAAKERRSADAIANAARNMGAMIRDLVEAVRLEGGGLTLEPEPIALPVWVRERMSMTAGVLDTSRLVFEFDAGLPPVYADPARLDRIVTNLVGNALKYSEADREVRVGARLDGSAVEVWVKDRGVGITPEDVPHVFERFYRGRLTSRSEGLGLGLFIVRTLVEAQGGTIHLESRVGEGSTFTFSLPVALPRAPDERA
ncbi:MAG TPA: MASE3 domain-containing protein [Anaeromyxobacteraceae bacterium]|nr:MASE3 domain-containing protein [Anaeromyxobacteraceae bacterium]